MKRTYRLKGLGCANCAAKMERAILRLPDVTAVSINFMTTKMVLETEEGKLEVVLEEAKKIIRKLEPQVEVARA